MKDNRLEQLCNAYTDLTVSDIQVLKKVASTLQLYADLSGAYMFIDCKMSHNEHAIIVAEAFPKKIDSLYGNSVVGKIVFDTFEPGVFYSYRTGKKSVIRQAVTQEGKPVEQSVVPIKNDSQEVIGVLIQEKEIDYPDIYQNEPQSLFFGQDAIDYVLGDQRGDMPIISDLLMEICLLTDQDNRLTYANPAGVKFITEMSHNEELLQKNLVELLPFIKPVFDQLDDVFVFELSLENKYLVVKKLRLRKKDKMSGTILVIQDLTELRTKEKELMMKSVVIQEIHHRVKNNLQTVASLLRLQMRNGLPEGSKPYFHDTLNRIYSISSVYEIILANEDADDDVDIVKLTGKICSSMVINDPHKKVELVIQSNGNCILTSSRKAVSIALIVNELVQNSLKHAFPFEASGEIIVDFQASKDSLALHISDNGVGMKKPKSSLGLEIVDNLVVNDLNGEFHYLPEIIGTHAVITFPVSPEVVIYDEKENLNS
ncbi:sensor histidine kinase [Neobacillus niacini]|uniref:sensor histidine kinase n=1 Tax=Neobacillus niacini TaxID=86668 RepID=UPI002041E2B7|nr:sensor histidine kinase [Neobacillus niacini]MCM3691949.1 sensor histidine kinase [Neobacillus niacini]